MARVFERGLTKPSGYRAAGAALEEPGGRRPPLALGEMEDAARPAVPGAGRFAGRLPPAARHAALCAAVAVIPTSCRSIRRCRAARCPRVRRSCRDGGCGRCGRRRRDVAPADGGVLHRGDRRSRTASSRSSARSAARCAPRCRSSRATDGSASSCRRSRRSRTISNWSRRPRTRRARLGLPVHIEGYAPPHDPRLNVIRVAPDPGVIEVNIHPASNWQDCVDDHRGDLRGGAPVAARRRQVHDRRPPHRHRRRQPCRGRRRDAERQPVPAPARPAEEPGALLAAPPVAVLPVLRPVHRPDQPGAAHRRGAARQPLRTRDRAGAGAACRARATPPLPWLVDRLFRNLLVDVTGNTHRSEICIDKLFSPDGPTGRLGLVEFRGFEMPPNARMSLAQQLLVRAIIARLWKSPLDGRFVRWGTTLHDRFMLPHYVWAGLPGRARRSPAERLRLPAGMVRRAARIPLPLLRRGRRRRASSWNCARRWSRGM